MQNRSLWRWYRARHPLAQGGLGCLALLIALFACALVTGGLPDFLQGIQQGFQQGDVRSIATPISNTGPRMGGQLADFVRAYGSPASTTTDSATFTGSSVQITASTSTAHIVNRVSASGPPTWTVDASVAFCSRFLPDGAQETSRINGDAVFIDYSSSMGQIVLQAQMTTCLLFIAPS